MAASSPLRQRNSVPQIGDVLAGLSVAVVLIPQALAYAELAGMPPYTGLYAAVLPPIAAAFAASSPYLQTGPVAMTSLLTFGALSAMAPVGSPSYIALAALLAIAVGAIRLGVGAIRFGWVAYLMSQPVVTGFTSAAALLILATQLPTAVGAAAPDGSLFSRLLWTVGHVGAWDPVAVGLSAVTLLLMLAGSRVHSLFPGVLVAVVLGIGFSRLTAYTGPTIGAVPHGFPPISLSLPWHELPALALPALVVALVGFAEPAAVARTYAILDRRPWDPDREFASQGIANLASGLSSGFPVGGSFSRSSLNHASGARTRWSGAVTGLAVLAFLPGAGLLAPLPRAVLGAIVIGAVLKLIAVGDLVRLTRVTLAQAGVGWVTFVATLLLAPRVDQAVLLGAGLAGVVHIWREMRVDVRTSYRDRVLRLEPQGVLFFGSAPALEAALVSELATHPDATRLVLDLEELGRIDYTGALTLRSVVHEAEAAGLTVEVSRVPVHAGRILKAVFGADRLAALAGGPVESW